MGNWLNNGKNWAKIIFGMHFSGHGI